ncbi:nucleotidyltransferase family protein [Halomonas vilamensis]|uniref:Nucleotidyltransferase family protein n=1 Tax=Vreelandella vilamensis TaxID=531309 RepID=A0ABU1H754_9GAMM|nr:nucleotidyltransferase family protein [Halomonas vilamensis]MDR5900039.1 nucleotidyltransferase family protein [Halomonas vilamensis]
MNRTAALIMAAGASSRFDGCKLLAEVNGQALLQQSIDLVSGVLPDNVYVVTGAWHRELMQAKKKRKLSGGAFIYADTWSEGLSASLVTGICHLERDYDAVLVVLADQVALSRDDLERLLATFDGRNIACGFYHGRRGVPAIFGRNSFPRLKQLSGDQGAKAVLYETAIPVLECSIPNASLDIDNREQLAQWKG